MATGKIRTDLTLDKSQYQRGIRDAQAENERFQRSARGVQRRLKGLGTQAQAAGQQLTAGITLPLAAAGGAAVKFATDFEEKAAEVQSTADLTASQMDVIKDSVQDVATATGESMDDIFDSYQKAVSGSLDLAESQELVARAAKASATGFGDMERLVDVSTTAFDAFRDTADSAEDVLDDIVSAAQNTQVNVEDVADAFSRSADLASEMGASQNELLSVLGVVSERMGDTQRGGRAVAQMFSDMIDPTDQARDAVADLFGSFDQFQQMVNDDALGALQELDSRLEQSDQQMADVFTSTQSLQAAMALLSDGGERAQEVFEKQANAAGSIQEAFEETENFSRLLSMAWNELQAALIPIGNIIIDMLQPALASLVERVQGATEFFQGMSDTMQRAAVITAGVVTAIGPLLMGLGVMAKLAAAAIPVITGFVPAMTAVGGAIASTAGIMTGVVAAAIGGFIRNWDAVVDAVNRELMPIFRRLSDVIDLEMGGVRDTVSTVGNFLVNTFNFVGDVIVDTLITALEFGTDKLEFFVNHFQGLIDFWSSAFQGDWQGAWDAIQDIAQNAIDFVSRTAGRFFSWLIDTAAGAVRLFSDEWADAMEEFSDGVREFSGINDVLTDELGLTSEQVRDLQERFGASRQQLEQMAEAGGRTRNILLAYAHATESANDATEENAEVTNDAEQAASDFEAALDNLNQTQEETESNAERIANAVSGLSDEFLRMAGFEPDPVTFDEFLAGFSDFQNAVQNINPSEQMAEERDKTNEIAIEMAQLYQGMAEGIANSFQQMVTTMIQGGDGVKAAFMGIIGVFVDFMQDLGQQMIKAGIAAQQFQANLLANPAAAIAAGVILTTAAAAVQATMEEGPGGGDNVPELAEGGIVTSDTLARVGEEGPEAVIPLDKLENMNNGGRQQVDVNVEGRLDGDDIRISNERSQRKRNRRS